MVPAVGLEPGQLPVADGLEDEAAQPHRAADGGDRAGRGALQHAGLDGQAGHPQGQGLEQVDRTQRVQVPVALGRGEQVAVARVLAFAVVAPGHVRGQPQAPDDRDGQQQVAARGLPVPGRGEQAGHRGQRDAEAPRRVHHGMPADLQGHGERDGHHDQQRGRRDQQREAERAERDAAHRAVRPGRSGLTARIWSTPIRPSSKARAPPARYRRHRRTCSGVRSWVMAAAFCSKLPSQARMVRA